MAIVLCDEENGAEYLNVQDVACETNILTGLVRLVRHLQVGETGETPSGWWWCGVVTASCCTVWMDLKDNSEQNSQIPHENIFCSNW
jgi:hypothetical protein